MNYIKHLSGFFEKISKDDRLNPTHVSLYISLFQFWNTCRFHNPISISRQDAMRVSKISSKVTYHKCIRELNDFGYLRYEPSYNPFKGSLVYLFDFGTGSKHVISSKHTKKQTGDEQEVGPYINHSNNTKQQTNTNTHSSTSSNNDNLNKIQYNENDNTEKEKKVAPKKRKSNLGAATVSEKEGKKSDAEESGKNSIHGVKTPSEKRAKKNRENSPAHEGFKRPVLSTVREHFQKNTWPAIEAEKFFNYYQANGWLIGGKAPMQSWQASAANWILNAANFSNGKDKTQRQLNATTGKDYSEPL